MDRLHAGIAGVDNRQLVAAAAEVAELLDLSLELDFSLELEPDFSLELEALDPESLDEEPLVELGDFLPDSRLSVR
ncbi:hypothetical protein A5624_06900 [Mycobacterium sp. 1482292.6]|nr:hypothetical protein A5624_06900 [Mycobacterium sp. 1482292.6]